MSKPLRNGPAVQKTELTASAHESAEFWAPVLLHGEDPSAYDGLMARVIEAVRPADAIEEMWVRDVVDLVWEVQRLRTLKAQLLLSSAADGLKVILNRVVGSSQASELAEAWYRREPEALKAVDDVLVKAGLDMRAVMAQTLASKLDDVERIDRMLANAEGRRNSVLREVDRHRAVVAARLRAAAEEVEEAEFFDVPDELGSNPSGTTVQDELPPLVEKEPRRSP